MTHSFDLKCSLSAGSVERNRLEMRQTPRDTISGDGRWVWKIWPNGKVVDFYFGIGSTNSAGPYRYFQAAI
jgi:hypothetical protein